MMLDKSDLSDKERAQFNYDVMDLVRYKNSVYDLGEFTAAIPEAFGTTGWDGIINETFFSGILIKFTDDPDYVIMGRYYT
jgi:hypothetical protein